MRRPEFLMMRRPCAALKIRIDRPLYYYSLPDIVITPEEVYECLCTLDQNKASGPDRIPATLLRHCASSICSSLSELFNKTLSVGKLPKEWKPQRAGLLAMLPITDLFRFYHLYPRYLRAVSTTGLLNTLEKNYIICSLVS